jgi:hypothetical protein
LLLAKCWFGCHDTAMILVIATSASNTVSRPKDGGNISCLNLLGAIYRRIRLCRLQAL